MTELNADYAAYNMIFCADPANFYVDDPNYNHNENTEEVSLKTSYRWINESKNLKAYRVPRLDGRGGAIFEVPVEEVL